MSLIQSLRHAGRSLRRTPAFTVSAVFTLVIGIGATTAIFAVLNGVILKPLPYRSPERLVGAWHNLPAISLTKANQTAGTYFTYKRLARTIDDIGLYQDGSVNVAEPGATSEPRRLTAAWATRSVFTTLGVAPLRGRIYTDAEDSPNGPLVVVISEALWRSTFGGAPDIVGRTIEINGRTREIVGVMPGRFRFPEAATHLWLPLSLDPTTTSPGGFSYNSIARLKDGVSVDQAERELTSILPRMEEFFPNVVPGVSTKLLLDQAKPVPVLVPLRQDVTGGIYRTLWMVAGAAVLVLAVACANVANLILVRADGRQRELAVREALGAGRTRVLLHFVTDSMMLAAAASVLGVGVAWAAIRALVAAGPREVPRLAEVGIDLPTVLFALAVGALTAVVCSAVPALRIGRAQLVNALREGGRSGTAGKSQHRVRGAIVALQMALALVALASSGLLLRSFQHLNRVRPGFNPDNVMTLWVSLPGARYPNDTAIAQFYLRLTDRVAALPGVQGAGVTSRLPLMSRNMNQNPFYAEDDATNSTRIPPLQIYTTADAGYFRVMGIPLLAGRGFDRVDIQRGGEAIISQRTAEHFWKDPSGKAAIGKRFRSLPNGAWSTVIGVVGNARDTSLATTPAQTVYWPLAITRDTLYRQNTLALVVRTAGEQPAIASAVQRVVRELDPTLPTFDVRPMTSVMRASMAQLSFTTVMLGAAAAVTLLLGAVGLYGVMAYLVTLRSRELGVRIALGARPRAVAVMMTRQGLLLAVIGIAAGFVLYAGLARFLRSYLHGVTLGDPLTLVGASLLLVAIAALASWLPAQRASNVDPATSLRAE